MWRLTCGRGGAPLDSHCVSMCPLAVHGRAGGITIRCGPGRPHAQGWLTRKRGDRVQMRRAWHRAGRRAKAVGLACAGTRQAEDVHRLYDILFFWATLVFVLVEGLILFAVVRYRRRPGDDMLPPQ